MRQTMGVKAAAEHDTNTAGSEASFLVELTAAHNTAAPVSECVMVGASSTVGLFLGDPRPRGPGALAKKPWLVALSDWLGR